MRSFITCFSSPMKNGLSGTHIVSHKVVGSMVNLLPVCWTAALTHAATLVTKIAISRRLNWYLIKEIVENALKKSEVLAPGNCHLLSISDAGLSLLAKHFSRSPCQYLIFLSPYHSKKWCAMQSSSAPNSTNIRPGVLSVAFGPKTIRQTKQTEKTMIHSHPVRYAEPCRQAWAYSRM